MAINKELTSPDAAVYRPWAWFKFNNPRFEDKTFWVNHPEGKDAKFRWFKSANVVVNAGLIKGELVVFEERYGWNVFWQSLRKQYLLDSESEKMGAGGIEFQFGYAYLKVDDALGDVGGKPGEGGNNCSRIFKLWITDITADYSDGGVHLKISFDNCVDTTTTKPGVISNMNIFEALDKMQEEYKKLGALPKNFAYWPTDKFLSIFNQYNKDRKITMPVGKLSFNSFLYKLLEQFVNPENDSKEAHDKKTPKISTESYEDGSMLYIFDIFDPNIEMQSSFSIDINPPDTAGAYGVGRHTALSFRPNADFYMYASMTPSFHAMDSSSRSIYVPMSSKDGLIVVQNGQATGRASTPTDSPISTKQGVNASSDLTVAPASLNSNMTPFSLDVDIVGAPFMDSDYLWQDDLMYVDVMLWNNSFIDDDVKWARESRVPFSNSAMAEAELASLTPEGDMMDASNVFMGPYDERMSGQYMIRGISHSISADGPLVTTLNLFLIKSFDGAVKQKGERIS